MMWNCLINKNSLECSVVQEQATKLTGVNNSLPPMTTTSKKFVLFICFYINDICYLSEIITHLTVLLTVPIFYCSGKNTLNILVTECVNWIHPISVSGYSCEEAWVTIPRKTLAAFTLCQQRKDENKTECVEAWQSPGAEPSISWVRAKVS